MSTGYRVTDIGPIGRKFGKIRYILFRYEIGEVTNPLILQKETLCKYVLFNKIIFSMVAF
jgi:hypothetical protein